MSTANSGYNTSDLIGVNSDPELSLSGFGHNVELRRSSNSSLPGADPTSFLSQNYRKFDELRRLLDNNKDSLKLEAMRRIIEMVARGQSCSELFAAVVKNVVSKNTEVRKLVYVYLERYAEEQQDLALLSVSTFQKALKDPNQLIRSCALRVLSSIRVPMITPIVMLAIKDCAQDLSPFVRKTVAHSIPKLYSLDPSQSDQLIDVIEKLMKDQFTMVIGSAIVAFEQVCPDRIIFIHQNYRKLCNVLPDIDEWGQVFVLNMLTRYARTQFLDPNKYFTEIRDRNFYLSTDSSSEDVTNVKDTLPDCTTFVMDPDHRLLLRASKSLLQSRNSSVVLAVVQLYYHIAPHNELALLVRPMTRLLKSHREIRTIVLTNIATISANHSGMFEPFLRLFFISMGEPTHVKKIKLEILINITNEVNATSILRELSVYLYNDDFKFVSATIQAIGRIAIRIPEISEVCLSGLLVLLSCTESDIAGESVVVIQKLLQLGPTHNEEVIIRLSKMLDRTENSNAKASIIWMIGEHCDKVPKIAPDVLRKAAKIFCTESDPVKHQTLNLASKLICHNSKHTRLLCQYVLSLGRYDLSYDIRDKSRLYRNLLFQSGDSSILPKYAKKIIVSHKPAPLFRSPYKDQGQWQLGSLSHYLNTKAIGYKKLPDFSLLPSKSSVRDVYIDYDNAFIHKNVEISKTGEVSSFYSSDNDTESVIESDTESNTDSNTDTDDNSDSDNSIQSTASSLSNNSYIGNLPKSNSSHNNTVVSETGSSDSTQSSDNIESSTSARLLTTVSSDLVVFDGSFDHVASIDTLIHDSFSNTILTHIDSSNDENTPILPIYLSNNYTEVMNKYNGKGISIGYRMLRRPSLKNPKMIEVEFQIQNHDNSKFFSGVSLIPQLDTKLYFQNTLSNILPQTKVCFTVGIDFNDSLQPAKISVRSVDDQVDYMMSIHPSCGELMLPINCSEMSFIKYKKQMGGMSLTKGDFVLNIELESMHNKIVELCNLNPIHTSLERSLCYAGVTSSNRALVLVAISIQSHDIASLEVNCDHMMISEILFSYIKEIMTA